MHNTSGFGWPRVARLGLLAGLPLAALTFALLGLRQGTAEAAALSPQNVAGFQSPEKLVITVGLANPDRRALRGTLRVELLGPDKKPLAQAEKAVTQNEPAESYRFEFPAPAQPPDRLTLRYHFGDRHEEVPLAKVLVVKAHETTLTASQEFHVGSTAALRCEVHGVRSLTETVPLAGAEVAVRLRAKDGQVVPLCRDKTGPDGVAAVRLTVPSLPAGSYSLEVATKSGLGEEKLEREVRLRSDAKVLLVTDKPLYQPGQVMHLRALALEPFGLKPVAGRELVFEVEDARGNKVFKRPQQTSAYGVASADFQLADEVNMGDYHVRAVLGEHQADKTVGVKKYVLPKFKTVVSADKRFYLPKETIQGELQADYFFGKPLAGSRVKVTASTFDVQFRTFQTWEGKTDDAGHAKFEIKLPDYFVGQPLQKGDALVRLEAQVTDTADHAETVSRTFPVSDQPIRVSLIPEGGKLVPGLENRVFAAAIYPDGSPARCDINVWLGREAKDRPFAAVKTNDAGLAEFTLKPKADQFRQGQWEQQTLEVLGGARTVGGPRVLLDLTAEAKDGKGNAARAVAELNGDPHGENVLLRLDKAIYRGGDTVRVDVRSSAGLPTAYLDVIRGGQTLLTHWLDVKDGRAEYRLDLPADTFGTLEVHAYQVLNSGVILRDSRVVYVQPADGLKVAVKPDKEVHQPGEAGRIRFEVTDARGKPTAAALGVLVVDEAVYALQDMQPGLEKVYFTLQEELLKPQAQAVFKPAESLDTLARAPELSPEKQQVAQVLLTAVRPKPPARWEVDPAVTRRQQVEGQLQQFGWALLQYALGHPFQEYDASAKHWVFKPGLLEAVAKQHNWNAQFMSDPFGKPWTLDALARLEKDFTAEHLARGVTQQRTQALVWGVINLSNRQQGQWLKDGRWTFPTSILADAVKVQNLGPEYLKDPWGNAIRLVRLDKKRPNQYGWTQFEEHELVSAGPDGEFGTDDDVKALDLNWAHLAQWWWVGDPTLLATNQPWGRMAGMGGMRGGNMRRFGMGFGGGMPPAEGAIPFGAPAPEAAAAAPNFALPVDALSKDKLAEKKSLDAPATSSGPAPVRVREYFPETMLWQPALITDEQGRAELPLSFADSITTWRLSASASSRGGLLGSTSAPLRVFQDFFVDLDLPVSLTQNDEVAFPVAVYNYLKTAQTVRLELQAEPWYELVDGAGPVRSLDLQPGEVTAVKFRIRARKIGNQPLTVKAFGSKLSDAIKRVIEVAPHGRKVEQVVGDRLTGKVKHTLTIPEHSVPDASKLLVKVYPGVMSQVLEGAEGMLRLPGG